MKDKKVFIFDMDGLLIESGRLAFRTYVEVAKEYNFEMIPDVYYAITGKNEEGIRRDMKLIYGDDANVDLWRDEIHKYRNQIIEKERRIHTKEGVNELLEYLREKEIKTVVASSNTHSNIKKYLELEGLYSLFDYVVSSDDVELAKPSPDIFLRACELADEDVKDAIVFEDSVFGIQASERAMIDSVLIEDNIYNMDSYDGKYKIKIDLNSLKQLETNPTYKFESLIDVLDYLKSK